MCVCVCSYCVTGLGCCALWRERVSRHKLWWGMVAWLTRCGDPSAKNFPLSPPLPIPRHALASSHPLASPHQSSCNSHPRFLSRRSAHNFGLTGGVVTWPLGHPRHMEISPPPQTRPIWRRAPCGSRVVKRRRVCLVWPDSSHARPHDAKAMCRINPSVLASSHPRNPNSTLALPQWAGQNETKQAALVANRRGTH